MLLLNADGLQALMGSCPDKDQIHPCSGNLLKSISLFNIPTVGLPLSLTLYHNSMDREFIGELGSGWRHNCQARLERLDTLSPSIQYVDGSGKPFDFELDGGVWKLEAVGNFADLRLTSPSSGIWHLTAMPQGSVMEFIELPGTPIVMRLAREFDRNGNAIEYIYNGSNELVAISDPLSLRQISLEWASGRISAASDPKGNRYGFSYDDNLLSSVELPSGCRLEYSYDESGRLVSRTDRDGNSTLYHYDEVDRLVLVEEPEEEDELRPQQTFSYSTVLEVMSHIFGVYIPYNVEFTQVFYTNPRGKVWEYRFNVDSTLWRQIDPLGHHIRSYYDENQRLLYRSEGYERKNIDDVRGHGWPEAEHYGPRDNPNNQLTRFVNDVRGNVLQSISPDGVVDVYTYDSDSRLKSFCPGQANTAIGGQWKGHYGEDGIILCAHGFSGDDIQQLPSYLDGVTPILAGDGGGLGLSRVNVDHDNSTEAEARWRPGLADHTTLQCFVPSDDNKGTEKRRAGYWTSASGKSMAFRVQLSEAKAFNLSLYTYMPEVILESGGQHELSGISIQFSVTDLRGTQSYHCTQNTQGSWVSFPVVGDETAPVLVVAKCQLTHHFPRVSAVAFDPFEDRGVYLEYDVDGNLVKQSEPTSNPESSVYWEFRYDSQGQLVEAEHIHKLSGVAQDSRLTSLFYEDDTGNLTRIEDPLYQATAPVSMEYDSNGNLLAQTDAQGNRTQMRYDERDRMVAVIGPLGEQTTLTYNGLGLLTQVVDPLGRATQLFYTAGRRLRKMVDAAGGEVIYTYLPDGLLESVTDPLGNTVEFHYDDAGNRVTVLYPEADIVQLDFSREQLQPELRFAFDCWSRIVSVTPPNGNQADLDQIQTLHAVNLLRNPGAEQEGRWVENTVEAWGVIPEGRRRAEGEAAAGDHSFTFWNNNEEWVQNRTPSHPGDRHLMRGAFKSTSAGASLQLRAVVRQFNAGLLEQTSNPIEPSGTWSTSEWTRVDTPGDAQVTAMYPAVHQVRVTASKPNVGGLNADQLELVPLSTHLHYQGTYPGATVAPDGGQTLTHRDRWGRPVKLVDSDGREICIFYDASSRVVSVEDSQGLTLAYDYDVWGNLIRFVDGQARETLFEYDELDRLLSITQPVMGQQELFAYSPVGNLVSYTNSRAETRMFRYDSSYRLVEIEYGPGDSVLLQYDLVGNLVQLQERSGDRLAFAYDVLNRMVVSQRLSVAQPQWTLAQEFDAVGNRLALRQPASFYGMAQYGTSTYVGDGSNYWTTPTEGFDSHNRRVAVADGLAQVTEFGYDIDGRLAEVEQPNGTLSRQVYDISGRLMLKSVAGLSAPLWTLAYAYSLASDRLGQASNWDGSGNSQDYALDASGRLERVATNRMVMWSGNDVSQGDLRDCEFDREGVIRLLGYNDDFRGTDLQLQRWEHYFDQPLQSAHALYQDDGLHLAFPRGGITYHGRYLPPGDFVTNVNSFRDYQWPDGGTFVPAPWDHYWVSSSTAYIKHRLLLQGEFIIELDMSEGQNGRFTSFTFFGVFAPTVRWGEYYKMPYTTLGYSDMEGRGGAFSFNNFYSVPDIFFNNTAQSQTSLVLKLRLERKLVSGVWKLIASCDQGGGWVSEPNWTTDTTGDDMTIFFGMHAGAVHATQRWDGFRCSQAYPTYSIDPDEETNQQAWPQYESAVHDAGHAATWQRICWQETLQANTDVRLQVAVSNDIDGPWAYVGPDGTADSYFTSPGGESLPALSGRYGRFRAFLLTTDGAASPELSAVQLSHSGSEESSLESFTYDDAGNLLNIQTVTDSGVTSESRTVNDLNQIVTRSGDWTYQYDANGCMTVKTNGAGVGDERWEFTWDEDDRLVQVKIRREPGARYHVHRYDQSQYLDGPEWEVIDYTYDSMGRMLTRDDGSNATTFVWDGWDLLTETTSGITTTYLVPDGQILSFIRGSETYQVHTDGLGSVRVVTDGAGDVVARFEYGAYGDLLGGSFDNVPGGLPYRFVGSLGCRTDSGTGLVYMRHRWYDPELQRFISRDPIGLMGGANSYVYADNSPLNAVDPYGLQPWWMVRLTSFRPSPGTRFGPQSCRTVPRHLTEARRQTYFPRQHHRIAPEMEIRPNPITTAKLPRSGPVRYLPPRDWKSPQSLPRRNGHPLDRFGNQWKKDPEKNEFDVQLSREGLNWAKRNLPAKRIHGRPGSNYLNVGRDGHITHLLPMECECPSDSQILNNPSESIPFQASDFVLPLAHPLGSVKILWRIMEIYDKAIQAELSPDLIT